MSKHVVVIGAGFGGLSAAAYIAKQGHKVTVLEKNSQPGGRALVLRQKGFTFELGPSWYMMPDVFEEFFADFSHTTRDYFELRQLTPSYRVFTHAASYDVHTAPKVFELFDRLEPGSAKRLRKLLAEVEAEYKTVRAQLLRKEWLSLREMLDPQALKLLAHPKLSLSYHRRIARVVQNETLQHILEFMVVFMGGSPRNIPAVYCLLAHVDMQMGIWYPMGGFGKLASAFELVAKEQGATILYNTPVEKIITRKGRVVGVRAAGKNIECDVVVSNADYWHTETKLLAKQYRSYDETYWSQRSLSPSGLVMLLGLNKKLPGVAHHNLFLDADWDGHFRNVFDDRVWTGDPLFYMSAPSVTDPTVAPKDHENLFVLAPQAAGLQPDKATLEQTADAIIQRIEAKVGMSIRGNIVYRDVRAQNYFQATFNAYMGNAFGLAHTLLQTAPLRPRIQSKKLPNLYFVGQYTNPGTGVPIVTLSGKLVGRKVSEDLFLG